ncbi:short-chain dehydrogenase/reductase family 9C member 7-like [Acropora millepora]|uniref:short-chain dehydrogenase/reductase family 9C member 7-like n=1 Tax=Acropora millepora TaxID=45264 RepID=UPI001CF42D7F|nr:short-chain dehydrogenase/reductase family 9C member 7-like [Acropora millepora]
MGSSEAILFTGFLSGIFYFLWKLFSFFRRGESRIRDVSGKYVLITGCGSGFGKEITQRLDHLGFRVLATCRTQEGVESVTQVCSEKIKTYVMDVTDTKNVQEVFEKIKNEILGEEGLWGLINNAGKLEVGMVDWQSLESFKGIADVNLWGTILVTQTFLPLVKKARGRVINMGSILGRIVMPYLPAYSISKYGVAAFSDALRREMLPWGVRVSIIEAGAHRTKLLSGDILAKQWESQWNQLTDELKQEYGQEGLKKGLNSLKFLHGVSSPNTGNVVSSVIHALTSRDPQSHYLIGLDAKALAWLAIIPTRLTDFLLNITRFTPGPIQSDQWTPVCCDTDTA